MKTLLLCAVSLSACGTGAADRFAAETTADPNWEIVPMGGETGQGEISLSLSVTNHATARLCIEVADFSLLVAAKSYAPLEKSFGDTKSICLEPGKTTSSIHKPCLYFAYPLEDVHARKDILTTANGTTEIVWTDPLGGAL